MLYETLAANGNLTTFGDEAHWWVENDPALRPGPGGGSPSPAEAHRRAIVMAAVALAEGPTDQREPTEGLA
jgi:hypothetical protein